MSSEHQTPQELRNLLDREKDEHVKTKNEMAMVKQDLVKSQTDVAKLQAVIRTVIAIAFKIQISQGAQMGLLSGMLTGLDQLLSPNKTDTTGMQQQGQGQGTGFEQAPQT